MSYERDMLDKDFDGFLEWMWSVSDEDMKKIWQEIKQEIKYSDKLVEGLSDLL